MRMEGLARLVWVVGVLFGVLSTYGAAVQVRNPQFRSPCLTMICGSAALIAAVVLDLNGFAWAWIVALAGCAVICAAAYWNGRRCGVIHLWHHVIRICFCALLVLGLSLT